MIHFGRIKNISGIILGHIYDIWEISNWAELINILGPIAKNYLKTFGICLTSPHTPKCPKLTPNYQKKTTNYYHYHYLKTFGVYSLLNSPHPFEECSKGMASLKKRFFIRNDHVDTESINMCR